MKKDNINSKFSEFAKTLSPTKNERTFVTLVYKSIQAILWTSNCIQIWSYPRYTAITVLHDLDILYQIWKRDENAHNPYEILRQTHIMLEKQYQILLESNEEYETLRKYWLSINLQTHSVTISFQENWNEIFWVDIVPWYTYQTNEFWDSTYKVPEILFVKHGRRKEKYKQFNEEWREMSRIHSDPRGYISVASQTDQTSWWAFRKSTKIVKHRKDRLKSVDQSLKLKSFHLEQVVTRYFQGDASLTIFDCIFKFFVELPKILENPNQIADRVNDDKFVDDYLEKLTVEQKNRIKQARDHLLIQLESIDEETEISEIFNISFYSRVSSSESFLFDQGIPTLTDNNVNIDIYWKAIQRGWFRERLLFNDWIIERDRKIEFWVRSLTSGIDKVKRKVRNDEKSVQPRGEITDGKTLNHPEHTKYTWRHRVECFAIKDNVCVAKAKQYVCLPALWFIPSNEND
jgi:hypothetical protein